MKNIYIFSLLFLTAVFTSAQSIKVEYEVQFKQQNAPSFGSEDFRKRVLEQQSAKQKHNLSYLDGNFMYESFPAAPVYDTVNKPKRIYLAEVPLNSSSQPKIKIITRKNDSGSYAYTKLNGEEFYQFVIPQYKILETKEFSEKILGYVCKLATIEHQNKLTTKVWFADKIPLKAGPLGFLNFPGLVLKVESENVSVEAKSLEMDAKNIVVEELDKNLKIYNQEEYSEKMKSFRNG